MIQGMRQNRSYEGAKSQWGEPPELSQGEFSVFLLAALGLCSCAGFPLAVNGWGYSPAAVCELLIAVPSLVEDHSLERQGLQ